MKRFTCILAQWTISKRSQNFDLSVPSTLTLGFLSQAETPNPHGVLPVVEAPRPCVPSVRGSTTAWPPLAPDTDPHGTLFWSCSLFSAHCWPRLRKDVRMSSRTGSHLDTDKTCSQVPGCCSYQTCSLSGGSLELPHSLPGPEIRREGPKIFSANGVARL